MPIDSTRVRQAMATGLSAVCALCEHYWNSVDHGASKCFGHASCGSPLVLDTFSSYKGPLTSASFCHTCFVCGEEADHCIVTPGKSTLIGICSKDLYLLAVARKSPTPVHVFSLMTHETCTPQPPKKTLRQLIAEDELNSVGV